MEPAYDHPTEKREKPEISGRMSPSPFSLLLSRNQCITLICLPPTSLGLGRHQRLEHGGGRVEKKMGQSWPRPVPRFFHIVSKEMVESRMRGGDSSRTRDAAARD